MRALTADEEARLRASIQRLGVLVPVVFDVAGHVVDGHNRKRIADDLGVPYPTLTLTEGAEVQRIGIDLNVARRHLTPEEREAIVIQGHADGMSDHAIAEATGIPQSTVSRVRRSASEPSGSTDEPTPVVRSRAGRRVTTVAQRDQRRAEVARMHAEGVGSSDIGRALGWSEKVIRDDLNALGATRSKRDEDEARGRLLQQFQDTCGRAAGFAHDVELLARRLPRELHASLFVQHGRAYMAEAFDHLANANAVFETVPDDASSLTDNPEKGAP